MSYRTGTDRLAKLLEEQNRIAWQTNTLIEEQTRAIERLADANQAVLAAILDQGEGEDGEPDMLLDGTPA